MRPQPSPHPSQQEAVGDPLKRAKGVNKAGKVIVLVFVVAFNVAFWTIAINEYITPAESYLHNSSAM